MANEEKRERRRGEKQEGRREDAKNSRSGVAWSERSVDGNGEAESSQA